MATRRRTDASDSGESWHDWFARFGLTAPPERASAPWQPTERDRTAAWQLHVEISTRITIQPLHYRSGDVAAALDSVYQLFPRAREILATSAEPCVHFELLVTSVLDADARPFTAKWHPRLVDGRLELDDQRSEFRADLVRLQPVLRNLDAALRSLATNDARPIAANLEVTRVDSPAAPMPQPAEFPREFLGLDGGKGQERLTTKRILELEKASIDARRATTTSSPSGLVGLALSGGGIRSATFCLGVLQVLARQRILDQVDYLSTVSGGGYLGAFLSSRPTADAKALLDNGSDAMRALRQRAHHHLLGEQALKGSLEIAFTWLRGLLLGLLAVYAVLGTAVGLQIAVQESGVPLKRVWFWTGIAIGVPVLFVLSAFVAKRPEGVVHRALRSVLQVLFAAAVLGGFVEFASWFHAWTLRAPFTSSAIGTSTVGLSAIVAFAAKLLRRRWIAALAIEIALTLLVPLALAWTYAELEGVVALADTGVRLRYVAVLVVAFLTTAFVSLNRISPHVFYRSRLVRTYLPEGSDALKLSALAPEASRMPYPIVNATVNLPGSRDLAMRGRKSASFVFTKHCCGSGATGWFATASVEKLDPSLDLGTAMAISGAAASSWMGTVTTARRVPLLTLLNVRLGYWLPNPRRVDGPAQARMQYLWRELSGAMKEDTRFLNVSDGGHIENLGILELLRRRCRFIVAVDAEADDGISCAGLITALRLARVDFDVKVALELDDLVRSKSGTTRKHFAFGLILYPDGPPGYLLYVKASLTGDEERHLVEYRARHPRFPHESTGDQFFDEEQFEAYRSLGEHIAERLFMPPFARSEGNERCDIDAWLDSLREHLLPDDHPDQDLRRRERESPDDQLLATAIDGVRAAGVQMRF